MAKSESPNIQATCTKEKSEWVWHLEKLGGLEPGGVEAFRKWVPIFTPNKNHGVQIPNAFGQGFKSPNSFGHSWPWQAELNGFKGTPGTPNDFLRSPRCSSKSRTLPAMVSDFWKDTQRKSIPLGNRSRRIATNAWKSFCKDQLFARVFVAPHVEDLHLGGFSPQIGELKLMKWAKDSE